MPKKIEVEIVHKKTYESLKFESITKAAEFIGVTPKKLHSIIYKRQWNTTDYYVTT